MRARIVMPQSAIEDLVVRPAVRVEAGSLGDVAAQMREANVSAVLLGTTGAIVTERDVARAMAAGLGPEAPAELVATAHPVRVPSAASIVQVAAVLLNEEVRHVVVELPGGGEAVVSMRDVMAVLLQATDAHVWLTSLRVAIGISPVEPR